MAARAIWKGTIRLPGIAVPIKLYSALQAAGSLHFRLLHEKDLTPVQGRMVHPGTGEPVPIAETRRGWVADSGELVVLEPDEIEALAPEPSRDVEVLRFVPAGAVDARWYDRPYWVGPDGDEGAWAALAAGLGKRDVVGIARWVMRKKEYVGALRLEHGVPLLMTLRRAGEVVDASALPRPQGRAPTAAELKLAEQLLRALEGPLDPGEWKDEHRERVMQLIEAKAKGKAIPIARARKRKSDDDLAAALAKSLAAARKSA